MGKNYLTDIQTEVRGEDSIYTITYFNGEYSGECIYEKVEMKGTNKPIRQKVYILTSTNMGGIVESINEKSPLQEEDLNDIQMEIREDSLSRLNLHLQ